MTDIVEVGQKVIDNILKTKPANAGDLVISVGDAFRRLRQQSDTGIHCQIDHLEALLCELLYGIKYELPDDTNHTTTISPDFLGEAIKSWGGTLPYFNTIAVSGSCI